MFRFAIVLLAVSLFVSEARAQSFNFNPQCAVQAAQQFTQCRAGGGGTFGCLVQAGLGYWQCSGSSFTRGPVRAALTGRRALRVARRY